MVRVRHGRTVLPQTLAGVRNAARAMTAYFDAVVGGELGLAPELEAEPRLRRWPGREVLSWGGERILAALDDAETVPRLKAMTGFGGRNVFFEPWACSHEAREDLRLFRRDRAAFKQRP